ncbi:MAG: 3-dehydroquinate synthase [Verrucomicrobiota bacterium]
MKVPLQLPGRDYSVHIGRGNLAEAGPLLASLLGRKTCALLTDSNVGPLYAATVSESLTRAGHSVHPFLVPAGEASKSLEEVIRLCREMTAKGLDRQAVVVALGGGVLGDLAGFVAAVFFRGVPFLQIPTTIVSQVDSSVGGKTGVNLPEGKNLVGAFHQPAAVLADVDTLHSLPEREFNEGFAEVIKHAAIREPSLLDAILSQDLSERLPDIIARNVAIKARIVEEDEKETSGTRAHLNFGHTLGHGIEAAAGYGRLLHGEAISLGLRAALFLSQKKAGLAPASAARVLRALAHFRLPLTLPADFSIEEIERLVARDKKFQTGAIRFVLVPELGTAELRSDLTQPDLREALEHLQTPVS